MERTIVWTMNQAASGGLDTPIEHPVTDLTPFTIEFSTSFDRPDTPDKEDCIQPNVTPEEDGCWAYESGIFDALQPLLARSLHRLNRREALAFYFESEIAAKKRNPAAPYSEILAQAHAEMTIRLGLPVVEDAASLFASSISTWPLYDGAVWCLQNLKPRICHLVALSDATHDILCQSSSFSALAPYFSEVFTSDGSHAYRPDSAAFDLPLKYWHDALGIPRQQRCLVSNSLLRDLEPARQLGVPAI
ncbi:hypothetical protein B0H14DRAFT_1698907 [Mycena olivaceomarginata]|nr:hypothetical protein B0H14DRAFT_1698907 [Mycena olivaceomarginata]